MKKTILISIAVVVVVMFSIAAQNAAKLSKASNACQAYTQDTTPRFSDCLDVELNR